MRMILWVLSVGGVLGSAYGLYHLEHEVKTMERALTRVEDATRRDNEAVQVLQAEWSYLNRPERLQDLATRHLHLGPSALKQIVTAPALLAALPVARPADDGGTETVTAAAIPVPEPKPAPPRRAVPAIPAPQLAQATPPPTPRTPAQTVAVPATFRIEDIRIGGGR